MKPQYFDLTVKDAAIARRFFDNVFGWRFEKFPFPYEYYRITAGSEGETGIDGGMGETKDAPLSESRPMTLLTMTVPSLDICLASIRANGGKVLEPRTVIPGIGWHATCAEPGGLMFGVIEADPSAAP
jgi:uncharacterized protein